MGAATGTGESKSGGNVTPEASATMPSAPHIELSSNCATVRARTMARRHARGVSMTSSKSLEYSAADRNELPFLYHYTSWAAFENICKEKALWLSHYDATNDRLELRYATKLLNDLAQFHKAKNCVSNVSDNFHERGYVHVASLSEEGDLLNQWRAYGQRAAGICLGFKMPSLLASMDARTNQSLGRWSLHRVVYDPGSQVGVFCSFLTGLKPPRRCTSDSAIGRDRGNHCRCCHSISEELKRRAPFFKDPHWHEEREWRLACVANEPTTQLRPRTDPEARTMPYVRFSLGESWATRADCPIDHVLCSPNDRDRFASSAAAIRSVLRACGGMSPSDVESVRVLPSNSPLRK
jgi:hypothetical protein